MQRFLILLTLLAAVVLFNGQVTALQEQPQTTPQTVDETLRNVEESSSAEQLTQIRDIRSLWQLTELGGGIRWAIFGILALAILFILKKIIELTIDYVNGHDLEKVGINEIGFEDLQVTIEKSRPSLIRQLMGKLFEIYYSTGRVEVLQEELNSFIKSQQDQFSRFRERMSFLSDTAGALGLLGTVWGMFLTFFGGTLDNQRILNGMGIALITTLLGIVVSIIINFASTEVSNFFNKRIEAIFAIVDSLRMRMIGNKEQEMQMERAREAMRYESAKDSDDGNIEGFSFNVLSDLQQTATVGKPLLKPLTIQVLNEKGVPVEGLEVVFELNGNGGYFPGNKRRHQVTSNKRGQATAHFQLDKAVGERKIRASLVNQENKSLEFVINGVPGPPARIEAVSGNHQSATVGQRLEKPLVVRVLDVYDNVIEEHPVTFSITKGNGTFENLSNQAAEQPVDGLFSRLKGRMRGQKVSFETRTDADGCAEATLILGPVPGVNQVSVVARGLLKSPLVFEAMAQPREEAVS